MSLTIKTCLIGFLAIVMSYASSNSEDMFIKGQDCAHRGLDSLACYYYGQAYEGDTASIILKDLYSKSLIKVGKKDEAVPLLRSLVSIYSEGGRWSEAVEIYRAIYNHTRSLSDGNMLALVLFRMGVYNGDTLRINTANKIWDYLMSQAKDSTISMQIINTRVQANEEVKELKNLPKTPRMEKSRGYSRRQWA